MWRGWRRWIRAAALAALALPLVPLEQARADEPRAPVPLIAPQPLVERIQAGERIVFVDVRRPEEFAPEHIPGALNIPREELTARAAELPRGAILIPYCNLDFRGLIAARELQGLGFEVALMQERGLVGWREQGLPVAGAKTGVSDAAGVERVRRADPAKLMGERFVERVPRSGRWVSVPVTVTEWHFEPNQLEVQAGDEVRVSVTSKDGDHFFVIPEFEVQVEVPEGQTREVVFVADRTGEYRFGSCEWDGSALQMLKGQLAVRPPRDRSESP